MSYIYPAPGVNNVQVELKLKSAVFDGVDGGMVLPALQDVTVNNANQTFTWSQLDSGSQFQIATTAENSLSMNIVLDQETFFGDSTEDPGKAANLGVFGLSRDKTLVEFDLYMGDTSEGDPGKTISGEGYVTGLAPTVSADSPVWVSPITITVTGDYTIT